MDLIKLFKLKLYLYIIMKIKLFIQRYVLRKKNVNTSMIYISKYIEKYEKSKNKKYIKKIYCEIDFIKSIFYERLQRVPIYEFNSTRNISCVPTLYNQYIQYMKENQAEPQNAKNISKALYQYIYTVYYYLKIN